MWSRPIPFGIILVLFATWFRTVSCVRNSLSSHAPLRCCFMREHPISFHNPQVYTNNGLDGVVAKYLLQHQAYLNWSCSTMNPFPHEEGNGFNQFIDTMFNCTNHTTGQILQSPNCNCDIGIGGWLQNSERFLKVDFLPPFVIERDRAFAHISNTTVAGNIWFFLNTFDGAAWSCILCLFILFICLKMLDRRFAETAPYSPLPTTHSWFRRFAYFLKESGHLQRLRMSMQSTASRMILLPDIVENGNSFRQWFLNLIIGVVALFLILSYEASMTAKLVQDSVITSFNSAEDFRSCRIPPSEVCLLGGGGIQQLWLTSIATTECHQENSPTYFNSYDELFEAMEMGKCKFGMGIESAIDAAIRGRYCGHFVTLGAPITYSALSLILPKGSPLTAPMSQATLDVKRGQTMPRLVEFFNQLPTCRTEVNTILSFSKLRSFFLMAFLAGALILLSLIFYPQNSNGTDAAPSSHSQPIRSMSDKQRHEDDWSSSSGRTEQIGL